MRKLQELSKIDKNFVAYLNVPWEFYNVLDNSEKEKFKIRWERMVEHEAAVVSRHVKKRMAPNEFAALVSFRISIPNWTKFATTRLARFAKEGRFPMIPSEIMKFTTIDGQWSDKLETQRRAETALFRDSIYPVDMPEDPWT